MFYSVPDSPKTLALVINENLMLERIIDAVEKIAEGNLSARYEASSEKDVRLEKAIHAINAKFNAMIEHINMIAMGRYEHSYVPASDKDELGTALLDMTEMLREMSHENKKSAWIKSGQAELSNIIRGDQESFELGNNILRFIARYLNALVGTIYQVSLEKRDTLLLIGSFALKDSKQSRQGIKFGEGLVGQCALEKEQLFISDIPERYLSINSSLGEVVPKLIILTPFLIEQEIVGVMELGFLESFNETKMELLRQVSENIAIALKSSQNSAKIKMLLEKQPR